MPYCVNCGKKRPAFLLSSNNLCFTCANEARKQANHQKYIESTREQYKTRPNRTYHVVGLNHYKDAIARAFPESEDTKLSRKEFIEKYPLGSKIPVYDMKAVQAAQLVREPTNPHDKNAIKVLVNGEHIGYIDRDTAAHFDAPLECVTSTTARIKESPCKEVTQDSNGKYHVNTVGYLDITVTISFK